MAKKKKSSRKKTAKKDDVLKEKSPIVGYVVAVLLIVAAIFLLIGGFNTGGSLPVGLFHGAYYLFGWGAYLTPFALIYWGAYKFVAEDRRLPTSKIISMAV